MTAKKTSHFLNNFFNLLAVLIVILVCALYISKKYDRLVHPQTRQLNTTQQPFDFGNQNFSLDGQPLTFTNGLFQRTEDGSSFHTAKIISPSVSSSQTRAAAILVDMPGGSGTFYYLVGAMQKEIKNLYPEPVFLGDRIKIASLSVDDPQPKNSGVITVQYFDRSKNSPMSLVPSQKRIARFAFEEKGNLIVIK